MAETMLRDAPMEERITVQLPRADAERLHRFRIRRGLGKAAAVRMLALAALEREEPFGQKRAR